MFTGGNIPANDPSIHDDPAIRPVVPDDEDNDDGDAVVGPTVQAHVELAKTARK